MNTSPLTDYETGLVSCTHTLFIVPKNGRRLRICHASDADKAEMIELTQELADILGVEVTFTNRYSFFGH